MTSALRPGRGPQLRLLRHVRSPLRHGHRQTSFTQQPNGGPSRSPGDAELLLQVLLARKRVEGHQLPTLDPAGQHIGDLHVERRRAQRIDHVPNLRTTGRPRAFGTSIDVQGRTQLPSVCAGKRFDRGSVLAWEKDAAPGPDRLVRPRIPPPPRLPALHAQRLVPGGRGGPDPDHRVASLPQAVNRPAGYGPPINGRLKAGDLFEVTARASVQFTVRPIVFRLIRVLDRATFDGWIWLDGYQLDAKGDAVARRAIFVQPAGLRRLTEVSAPRPRRAPNSGRHTPPVPPGRSGLPVGPLRHASTSDDSRAAVSTGRTSTPAWLTSSDRTSNRLSGVNASASAMNRSWRASGIERSAVSRT